MIKRTLRDIYAMLGLSHLVDLEGVPELEICGVSTDSRTLKSGNLFIPLIGEQFDGHTYVEECFAKGAAAALWQADHPHPPAHHPLIMVEDTLLALQQLAAAYRRQLAVRVVGITGSNGKTTTKEMVASVLSTRYIVHKNEGNLNNHIGLPLTLLAMDPATEVAVLEMGMSGRGEIELLSRIAAPQAAIVTNIGEAHLLQLGSREEITRAKLEIIAGLDREGMLIYDGDERLIEETLSEFGSGMTGLFTTASLAEGKLAHLEAMKTIRFGLASTNDIYPLEMAQQTRGTQFTCNITPERKLFIPMLGRHNVLNALAAIALGGHFGLTDDEIIAGLHHMQAAKMRIELIHGTNGLTVLNDAYNASPTSVKAALQVLEELTGYGRKIVILGDMLELGDQEAELHRSIGAELSPERFDYVFTYGDLARRIAEEAKNYFPPERVFAFMDKQLIIQQIAKIASKHDIVLVKASRGMKLEEIIAELTHMTL